ncbi:lambda-exonuclease family protein [Candidatus Phytoplasma sacchari]|uniref:YqaJ viral recombinase family protein n=1 Tax=Candidatus Phytoplasma sacchari TaxID=2609813 RepID=A0ABY7M189_9MOLU|nr:YqaJ viral recombinase family protein [Candidatus Phytoplasma sacchari]KAB8122234.1 endonuclease [Candidatus Phytoplasma sacchari]WBL31481.1 YqaJ viral recombinase family protein [Candidatus Phytoplasma sacchari]
MKNKYTTNYLKLEQNSNNWHKHRKKYINASEVATIMDLNPFDNKKFLFKRKLFGEKIEDNLAMKHGRSLEPEARNFFNDVNKTNFTPIVCVKDFLSASLDGWDEKSKKILEIKCPFSHNSPAWKNFFVNNEIPIYYYAQIQAQLYCSNAEKAFFLVYHNYQNAKVQEVEKNVIFINKMYQKCLNFHNLFIKAKKILHQIEEEN